MSEDIATKIGKKIRAIRKQKNLTLKELAELSGISTSMISKIEKAQTLPPVSTYANIASGLGTSFGDLFQVETIKSEISVVRSNDTQVISRGPYVGSPLAYQKTNKLMEPFLFEYPPMDIAPEFRHNSEEMLFVLEGTLEFKYGEELIILEAGDCAYFNGNTPHGGRSIGDNTTRALVVQSSR